MECVLLLEFQCQIFKNSPRVRIFIGNIFIDEFDVGCSNLENQNTHLTSITTICREYLIDLPIEDTKILIDVYNDDNNYTNGFMTKFTGLKLKYLNLIPKKLWKLKNRVKENWPLNKICNKDINEIKERKNIWRPVFDNMASYSNFYSKNNKVYNRAGGFVIGESGYYEVPLYKKHGIFWATKVNGYCRWNFSRPSCDYLVHKYC